MVEEPANAGTSREAMLTTSPEGLKRMEDGSSSEEILAPQEMPRRFKVWECGRYGDLEMMVCSVNVITVILTLKRDISQKMESIYPQVVFLIYIF